MMLCNQTLLQIVIFCSCNLGLVCSSTVLVTARLTVTIQLSFCSAHILYTKLPATQATGIWKVITHCSKYVVVTITEEDEFL